MRGCQDTAVWEQFQNEQLPPLDDAWIADLLAIETAKKESQAEAEEAGSRGAGWEAQAASLFGDDRDEDE